MSDPNVIEAFVESQVHETRTALAWDLYNFMREQYASERENMTRAEQAAWLNRLAFQRTFAQEMEEELQRRK